VYVYEMDQQFDNVDRGWCRRPDWKQCYVADDNV
jgi:hypothetical protein